ncbi:MAG TPA: formate dehydrogenase [Acetobacteraceae bacterium]|jgi:formate dehydrogenase subunit delta|nr:formate dehydrogenase [Acetobacteraceae bacterium]
MSPEKLVYMANQIGRFFAHQPEEKAVANTADHLVKFWDPRMRKAILGYVDAGGQGLQPLVLKAVLTLKLNVDSVQARTI